jgi:hypothetical protein
MKEHQSLTLFILLFFLFREEIKNTKIFERKKKTIKEKKIFEKKATL